MEGSGPSFGDARDIRGGEMSDVRREYYGLTGAFALVMLALALVA